tara:strand:- start:280 stop:420 length:141 start_codon:yes stop_codon:yes gene_type:complete
MSPIGTIKVTIIKSNNGKTNIKALILFLRSVFLRLSFKGIPPVVNI